MMKSGWYTRYNLVKYDSVSPPRISWNRFNTIKVRLDYIIWTIQHKFRWYWPYDMIQIYYMSHIRRWLNIKRFLNCFHELFCSCSGNVTEMFAWLTKNQMLKLFQYVHDCNDEVQCCSLQVQRFNWCQDYFCNWQTSQI